MIPVICGPTAAGKSAIAQWLASKHDLLIISADSRQVYRGFDIGTSKPSEAELKAVPHRGVDVADPIERYSAAAWVAMAQDAIRQASSSKLQAVIVGGTGFYIASLFNPLFKEPELDASSRAAIQSALADESTENLRRWCSALDPARAHLGRTQLLRAIEIALITGTRLSDLHKSTASQSSYTARYLVVDPGPVLSTKIAVRTGSMFKNGWIDEVRQLMKTVPADAPAWNASGYRTVRQHVEGTLDRETAIEHIVIQTRQYAKRQRTWFRNQLKEEQVTQVSSEAPDWENAVHQWFLRSVDSRVTSHESR
jgi:tRNA dimethylallyltransferase